MSIPRDHLHTLDLSHASTGERLPAVHPGEVLGKDFLEPLGLSQYRLAKDTRMPAMRISQIVRGQRAITADTAYRLALYFGGDAGWWLRLQAQYDMEVLLSQDGDRLRGEVRPHAAQGHAV